MPPICRSEADWLVGINGTRAMTAFNSKSGGFQKTTVGRVQTPTLAILVEREEKIRAFLPRDYWEVHATFGATAGEYTGRWFDEKFARSKDDDPDLRAERLWDEARANGDRGQVRGQARHRHRREQADDAGLAAAVRSDELAARGQRPLWLFRAHHAVARAGALRKAQGADLSANRFARAAGGLSRHGEATLEHAGRDSTRSAPSPARSCKQRLGETEQAHFQQREDFRSLRDHSDTQVRRST